MSTWRATVRVTLKRGVLDPQGTAVRNSLGVMGYPGVADVRVGKLLELRLEAADRDAAARAVDEMCKKLLANPVIEQYAFELSEAAPAAAGLPS